MVAMKERWQMGIGKIGVNNGDRNGEKIMKNMIGVIDVIQLNSHTTSTIRMKTFLFPLIISVYHW